jgi:hypothetical protein
LLSTEYKYIRFSFFPFATNLAPWRFHPGRRQDDDPLLLTPPVIAPGSPPGSFRPNLRARRRFPSRPKKSMIENGFEGVGLAFAAVAICLGLACVLFVGVAAAVLLALARRSHFGDDDDARDDGQDYRHAAAAQKERAYEMPRRAGAGVASSNSGGDGPAASPRARRVRRIMEFTNSSTISCAKQKSGL